MGEMEKRTEIAPRSPRARMMAPSSMSCTAECMRGQPVARIWATAAVPSPVPTTTMMSPAVKVKSGRGLASTCPSRTTATMEAPVRVRARVSPRGVRRGGAGGDGVLLGDEAFDLAVEFGEVFDDASGAEEFGDGVGLFGGEGDGGDAAVGVFFVVDDQVAAAGAVGDDAELAAASGGHDVLQADSGQSGPFDVHGASSSVSLCWGRTRPYRARWGVGCAGVGVVIPVERVRGVAGGEGADGGGDHGAEFGRVEGFGVGAEFEEFDVGVADGFDGRTAWIHPSGPGGVAVSSAARAMAGGSRIWARVRPSGRGGRWRVLGRSRLRSVRCRRSSGRRGRGRRGGRSGRGGW